MIRFKHMTLYFSLVNNPWFHDEKKDRDENYNLHSVPNGYVYVAMETIWWQKYVE